MKTLLSFTMLLLATSFAIGDDPSAALADAETKEARLDQLHASVQRICPVSGQQLGSMGAPIKVAIGAKKEHVFLCCDACKKGKLKPAHWSTIHKNIKKAQAKCPVMGKPLPKKSTFTIVDGKVVYVCCPPCTDKIEADSAPYLAKVHDAYKKFLAMSPELKQ